MLKRCVPQGPSTSTVLRLDTTEEKQSPLERRAVSQISLVLFANLLFQIYVNINLLCKILYSSTGCLEK